MPTSLIGNEFKFILMKQNQILYILNCSIFINLLHLNINKSFKNYLKYKFSLKFMISWAYQISIFNIPPRTSCYLANLQKVQKLDKTSFHAAAVMAEAIQMSGGTIGSKVWRCGDWSSSLLILCFFWRALQFWNQTCVTRLLKPVMVAILSRSWPSGLLSRLKFAWRTWSCSSVNVVRILFDLFLW